MQRGIVPLEREDWTGYIGKESKIFVNNKWNYVLEVSKITPNKQSIREIWWHLQL